MTSPKGESFTAINKHVILASRSKQRLALLAQLGVVPARIMPAQIDETPLPNERPRALAWRLAAAKMHAIAAQAPSEHIILAADTVVAVGARIVPVPATEQDAQAGLQLLSGRAHMVYTALCVCGGGKTYRRLVSTRVTWKRLHSTEIAKYLASKEWCGRAGGYAIQGRAAGFVKFLRGSYSNVVGLPLYETEGILKQFDGTR